MYIAGSSDAGSQKSRRPITGAASLISYHLTFKISTIWVLIALSNKQGTSYVGTVQVKTCYPKSSSQSAWPHSLCLSRQNCFGSSALVPMLAIIFSVAMRSSIKLSKSFSGSHGCCTIKGWYSSKPSMLDLKCDFRDDIVASPLCWTWSVTSCGEQKV